MSAISGIDENSGDKREGGSGQRGNAFGRSGGGEGQSPRHDAFCELDLVSVVAGRFGVLKRRLGRAAESGGVSARAGEHVFGRAGAPGLRRDAAKRDPRLDDRAVLDAQRGGGRNDREGVGGALANFEVAGVRREAAASAGRRTATINSPGSSTLSRSGASPGRRWKFSSGHFAAPALPSISTMASKRDKGHAEIRGVRRDAGLAPAEHRMLSGVAAARLAAGARLAFVAGAGDVVEIGASRALQKIAADRRGVAKLRRGAGKQRFGDRRKASREGWVMREIGVAHERADPNAAIGRALDPVEPGKAIDVDETARAGDAALHQIEKIGAAGEIGGAGR